MRDLTRYRMKTVQARTSEIQRLGKALESAGIKLGSVVSEITGHSATAMIEALIDGERRGGVLADLAHRPDAHRREAGRPVDGADRPVHRAPRADVPAAPGPDHGLRRRGRRAWTSRSRPLAARWQREAGLLKTLPGFGDVVAQAWLAEIGPAPHQHFASHEKLASWVTLCPGNNISASKRKHGRTGDAGDLHQADADPGRLGRDPGPRAGCRPGTTGWSAASAGRRTRARRSKAITAIAHTLLKIAYQVLKSGTPYQDLGADFYTRRESPEQKQAYLERQLQKLHPGCTVTITISPSPGEAALAPAADLSPHPASPGAAASPAPRPRRTT